MLYNPKWDEPSLAGFIAWLETVLETVPPDEQYDYPNPDTCCLAQYGKATGYTRTYNSLHERVLGSRDHVLIRHPWTFGAALKRARTLFTSLEGKDAA